MTIICFEVLLNSENETSNCCNNLLKCSWYSNGSALSIERIFKNTTQSHNCTLEEKNKGTSIQTLQRLNENWSASNSNKNLFTIILCWKHCEVIVLVCSVSVWLWHCTRDYCFVLWCLINLRKVGLKFALSDTAIRHTRAFFNIWNGVSFYFGCISTTVMFENMS